MLALPAQPHVLQPVTEGRRHVGWPSQHSRSCPSPSPRGGDTFVWPCQHSRSSHSPSPRGGDTLFAQPAQPLVPKAGTEGQRRVGWPSQHGLSCPSPSPRAATRLLALPAQPLVLQAATEGIRRDYWSCHHGLTCIVQQRRGSTRWIGASHGRGSLRTRAALALHTREQIVLRTATWPGPARCARRCPGPGPGHPSRLGDNRKSSTGSAHDRPPNKALQLTRLIPLAATSTGC